MMDLDEALEIARTPNLGGASAEVVHVLACGVERLRRIDAAALAYVRKIVSIDGHLAGAERHALISAVIEEHPEAL